MTEHGKAKADTYHDLAAKHVSASRIIALFIPYKMQIARVICLILVCSATFASQNPTPPMKS